MPLHCRTRNCWVAVSVVATQWPDCFFLLLLLPPFFLGFLAKSAFPHYMLSLGYMSLGLERDWLCASAAFLGCRVWSMGRTDVLTAPPNHPFKLFFSLLVESYSAESYSACRLSALPVYYTADPIIPVALATSTVLLVVVLLACCELQCCRGPKAKKQAVLETLLALRTWQPHPMTDRLVHRRPPRICLLLPPQVKVRRFSVSSCS